MPTKRVQKKAWKDLKHQRIQRQIKRIPQHIKEIIRLKGGNEYREGLLDIPRRVGPLEYYVPQNNWEDILDKDKENLQLKPKVKAKLKRALKKAVKSAAGAAPAAVFAMQEA